MSSPNQPQFGLPLTAEERQRAREEYQLRLNTRISTLKTEGWTFIGVFGTEAQCGAFYWCRRQNLVYDVDFIRVLIISGGYHYGFKDPQMATLFSLRWS